MADSSPGLRVSPPRRICDFSPSLLLAICGAAVALALGWVSTALSLAGKAPVGLVSLGVGAALGLLLVALDELLRANSRRSLVLVAVLLSFVTVAAEHGWLYREYRQKWWQNRAEQPAVSLFRSETSPLSLPAYIKREFDYSPRQAWFWALDAVLIVAGAVGVVMLKEGRQTPPANESPVENRP